MKKTIVGTIAASFLFVGLAFASVPINKAHKGKTGRDSARINCAYCHKTAAVKKEKGQDSKKIQKNKLCAGSGCH